MDLEPGQDQEDVGEGEGQDTGADCGSVIPAVGASGRSLRSVGYSANVTHKPSYGVLYNVALQSLTCTRYLFQMSNT